jgi:small subunit ribosomal protein S2
MEATGATEVLPKKEVLRLAHEREKLERNLGGIRDMTRPPAAVWVVDTRKEHIAVTEARKLGIPVVAILDTNCDPDEVDYPIPGNDDAIRAGTLLTRIVADAVAEGLRMRAVYGAEGADQEGAAQVAASPADEEPLAEWERELLESGEGAAATGEPAGGDAAPQAATNGARAGEAAGSNARSAEAPAAAGGRSAEAPTARRARASEGRASEAGASEAQASEAPAGEAGEAATGAEAATAGAGSAAAETTEAADATESQTSEDEADRS